MVPSMLLSTDIWVGALIRRVEIGGGFAMVVRKGDPRAGAVLVKVVNRSDRTCRLLSEATKGDGDRIWMEPVASRTEADLDRYIERAARVDEAARRRTFAIISHPDAGKTTLTENLLLAGGAIRAAGPGACARREPPHPFRLDEDRARARHLGLAPR
jgi:hypothetical protein